MIGARYAALCALLGVTLLPQGSAEAQGWVLGLEAGATSSTLHGVSIREISSLWGGVVGANVEYQKSDRLSFPVGIQWAQRGGKGTTQADEPFEIATSYVEVPAFINLTLPYGPTQRLGIYFGLQLGWQVGCDVTSGNGDAPCGETTIFDTTPEDLEWSVPFGFEYDWRLSSGHFLGFDIRYTYGFTQIMSSSTVDLGQSGWQFMGSWGLPLGG